MGTKFIESGVDYSAISIGHAGLYTSVTAGLDALFETRRSASKAIYNSAPSGVSGSVLGAPTFSAGSAAVTLANTVLFGAVPPSSAISHTLAVIVKKKTGGVAADQVAGNFSAAAATKGATYFSHYNSRLTFTAYHFASGSVPPLASGTFGAVFVDVDGLGDYELFVGVAEANVSMRLYRPKTGAVVTAAIAGRDFVHDAPPVYRAVPAGSATQDLAMFAHWNRAITAAEIATFYAEMKEQYARLGLAI